MTTDRCPNCGYTLKHTTVVTVGPRGATVRAYVRFCSACGFRVVDRTELLEDGPQPMDIEFGPFNSGATP